MTKHLKNVYESGELSEDSTCANFAQVADNGKTYQYKFYSPSAIIAVGYRINSGRATQFRQWATKLDAFLQFNDAEILMTMADWASKLDAFLKFNDAEILQNKGKVTPSCSGKKKKYFAGRISISAGIFLIKIVP